MPGNNLSPTQLGALPVEKRQPKSEEPSSLLRGLGEVMTILPKGFCLSPCNKGWVHQSSSTHLGTGAGSLQVEGRFGWSTPTHRWPLASKQAYEKGQLTGQCSICGAISTG